MPDGGMFGTKYIYQKIKTAKNLNLTSQKLHKNGNETKEERKGIIKQKRRI